MGRKTLKKISVQGIIIILASIMIFIFSGCGDEPEQQVEKSKESGRIALSITWKTQSADSDIQNPDGTLNCENSDVAYIYAAVYDSENRFLGDSGSQGWDCNEHSGVIEGIEAGEGRRIVILGKNLNNEVVFRGEQNNVTVTAGQTVKPEPIVAEPFSPELIEPDDGATLTSGAFKLQWSNVPGATEYQIVISMNSDLSNPVIKTTTATEYPSEGLSTDVLYYWRVDAVDNFGNTGKSTPFSFRIEKEVNLPPVLDPIGDKKVTEDETLTFFIQATDPEGKDLTFSAGNLPAGATFNPTTRQFVWTPDFYQGGKSYPDILFYVSDNIDQRDEETITITVGDDGVNHPPQLNSIGNKSINENSELRFTISAIDPDSNNDDNLIYEASSLPAGASFNVNTHEFRWTPGYNQAGAYQNVIFKVTDESGDDPLSDYEVITITVGDVNRPPVLASIGNRSVEEDKRLTFTITANDPDGDSITYTAESNGAYALPAGWIFNASTRTFTWRPEFEDTGNYQIIFTATDDGTPVLGDSEEIWISVGDVNRPPVLSLVGNKAGTEGIQLRFTVTATDSDGNTLTFSAESNDDTGSNQPLPTGWNFNADTKVFTWIPTYNDAGQYDLKFTVVDNGMPNLDDSETIVITIANANRAPVLTPIGHQVVNEGNLLTFSISGTDPDSGDTLTYSATSSGANPLPSGWSFVGNTFSWRPEYDEAGSYDITFTVRDNSSPSLTDSEIVTISVTDVNGQPTLNSIGDKPVNEGSLLQFTISASDPDLGDTLTYSASGLPDGATFNTSTHVFRWTPGYDAAGDYNVTFAVTDNGSPVGTDTETVTIRVSNVNRSPVLNSIGNRTVSEGSTLSFTASASDPDGDGYTFSLSNAPTGASIDANSGVFTWTPAYNQSGTYTNVRITVTDNGSPVLSDSEQFSITVGEVNRPPVLNAIGNRTVNEGGTLTFTATAIDPDGDDYTFSLSNAPSGASINANSGVFTWTPGYGQSGTYTNVQITVTDDGSPAQSDSEQFSITVGDVNRPPVLNAIGNRTVNEGSTLNFTATASDPDGDDYTFSLSNAPTGASINPNTGAFTWTTAYGQSGIYTNVQITVTDNGSPAQSDSEQFSITVGDVNRPPVLNVIGNRTVNEGGTLSFTATASDPDGDDYTFSLSNAPSGASINANSGVFTWTPGYGQSGTYTNVQITVTDNGSPAQNDSEQFSITVGDVNRPPVLNPIGNQTIDEGDTLSFTVTASDPDGDDYEFTISNSPAGASFDPDTGEFIWTPLPDEAGDYVVTFTVMDDGVPSEDDSETVTITVNDTL